MTQILEVWQGGVPSELPRHVVLTDREIGRIGADGLSLIERTFKPTDFDAVVFVEPASC